MATVSLSRQEASRGDLPAVCVVCGEPATEFRSKTMIWHLRSMRVHLPLCRQHGSHWSIRAWTTGLSFAGISVLTVATLAILRSTPIIAEQRLDRLALFIFTVCLIWLALLIGSFILDVILQQTAVRPQEIQESYIRLKGVHARFIDALEEYHDSLDRKEQQDGSDSRNRGS